MQMTDLQDLMVENLKDLYSAEQQMLKAMPKVAKATENEELRAAFEQHMQETQTHIQRLEQIFQQLGEKPTGKKCKGMEGLLEEGKEMMEEDADPDVLDAAMISSAQRIEHYEIAAYGTLRTYARQLGLEKHAELLQRTLDEEGETDKLLTQIAESRVNVEAED